MPHVVSFLEDEGEEVGAPRISKAEQREQRRQKNLKWKALNCKLWSGLDPNPHHTSYYKSQFPELAEEWDSFQASLASSLPVTFRISSGAPAMIAQGIENRICNEVINLFILEAKYNDYESLNTCEEDLLNLLEKWCGKLFPACLGSPTRSNLT